MTRHDKNTKIMLQVFSRNWRTSFPVRLKDSWWPDKSRVYYLSVIIETDWLQILIMYFITYWIQYTHTHVYLFHIYAHVCTRVKETMLIPCILLGAHHTLASQVHCDSTVVEVPHLELWEKCYDEDDMHANVDVWHESGQLVSTSVVSITSLWHHTFNK